LPLKAAMIKGVSPFVVAWLTNKGVREES
jgi:hypothetical protein